MKKIAVVAVIGNPNSGATRGVFEKVCAQVNALSAIGYRAQGFFGIAPPHKLPTDASGITAVSLASPYGKFFRKRAFLRGVLKQISDFEPDILYLRYPLADPPLFLFLQRLRRAHPNIVILVERQTKEIAELLTRRSPGNLAKALSEWLFRRPVQKFIDFNVGVTQEICDYIGSYACRARCIPCGNGIPSYLLDEPCTFPTRETETIRLVFVGNITLWCGLELVISHLRDLKFSHRGKRVVLDVVGDGVFLDQLKSLFPDTGDNVTFHGFLAGAALREKITGADLALGALNNKKRQLTEGSNLKLRLYSAYGLRFVLSEYDADFSASEEARDFFLDFSEKDRITVDCVTEMLDFALGYADRDRLTTQMQAFTRANLTWEVKMQSILAKTSDYDAPDASTHLF